MPGMQTLEWTRNAADQDTAVHASALPKADRAWGGSCRDANGTTSVELYALPMVAEVGEGIQGKAHQSNPF